MLLQWKVQASTKPDYYFESGSLTAGSFYHIGRRSGTGGGGFDDWFGVAADMYTNSNTFNGDDAIILSKLQVQIQSLLT